MEKKNAFFKNYPDTLAIIGVNLGIGAILVSLWLANCSRIDATNARSDTLYTMFYDLLREVKK